MTRQETEEVVRKIRIALHPKPPQGLTIDRLERRIDIGDEELIELVAYLKFWCGKC